MSQAAAIVTACLVLSLGCDLAAFRCLADRLLMSAALYTLTAVGLMAGAVGAAIHAL
jgi:hypothetical protein